jgi:hypothetical protein
MSNLGLEPYWTGKYKMKDLVQLRHPMTKRFVLIDRANGRIIAHKISKEPYKNITMVVSKKVD